MPLYFDVPCGKCEECRNNMRSEWFVRSFYEWQEVQKTHGCGMFYTLTYNNTFLPHYKGIPCFSKRDIQLFIKRLRFALELVGVRLVGYLLTCENGERFDRPHYHVIFFLSSVMNPWKFYHIVEKEWQNGFVYAGRDGGIVNSVSGILYVTKYCCKDTSYLAKDGLLYNAIKEDFSNWYQGFYDMLDERNEVPSTFDELIKNHTQFVGNKDLSEWYNGFMRTYRAHSPFNAHSNKLGYCIINHPHLNRVDDTILMPSKKGWNPVPIPRYVLRNLWYDRLPNEKDGKFTRFVLSPSGKAHFIDTLDSRIDKVSTDIASFMKSVQLSPSQFSFLKTHFDFSNVDDLNFFLRNLNLNYRYLSIYKLVYRNRYNDLPIDFPFFQKYKEYLTTIMEVCENPKNVPLSQMFTKDINYLHSNLFNYHPKFELYENIVQLHSALVALIRKGEAEKRLIDEKKKRELKDLLIKIPQMK